MVPDEALGLEGRRRPQVRARGDRQGTLHGTPSFTNGSGDILQIFWDPCEEVRVRFRDSKPNTVSIARREDVAALDAFIGPKA